MSYVIKFGSKYLGVGDDGVPMLVDSQIDALKVADSVQRAMDALGPARPVHIRSRYQAPQTNHYAGAGLLDPRRN